MDHRVIHTLPLTHPSPRIRLNERRLETVPREERAVNTIESERERVTKGGREVNENVKTLPGALRETPPLRFLLWGLCWGAMHLTARSFLSGRSTRVINITARWKHDENNNNFMFFIYIYIYIYIYYKYIYIFILYINKYYIYIINKYYIYILYINIIYYIYIHIYLYIYLSLKPRILCYSLFLKYAPICSF